MRYSQHYNIRSFSQSAPVTRALCALLFVVSLFCAARQNLLHGEDLAFIPAGLMQGQLYRLITYIFVEQQPLSLLFSTLVLWMVGSLFEQQMTSKRFARFVLITTIGSALLMIPISFVLNLLLSFLFQDICVGYGPNCIINAMFVMLALQAPRMQVLLGFVLPVPMAQLLWILPTMDAISGIFQHSSTLSMTLAGMAMGLIFSKKLDEPRFLWRSLQSWLFYKRRSVRLYVVKPKNNDRYHIN